MTVNLPPPNEPVMEQSTFREVWFRALRQIADRLSGVTPPMVPTVYVNPTGRQAGLPSAGNAQLVLVVDEVGGPTLAVSSSGRWLRTSDNAEVS